MKNAKLLILSLGLLLASSFALADGPIPIAVVKTGSVTITAGVASAATALPLGGPANTGTLQVELQNNGTAVIFVEFCNSATCAAAVATGYPILVGQSKVVSVNPDTTYVATISGTAAQTLYVTIGTGQ